MSLEEQAGLHLVEPCSVDRDLDFILFLGPWAPMGKVLNKWGRGGGQCDWCLLCRGTVT